MVSEGRVRCIRCAPTSITGWRPRSPPSALRRQGLIFKGEILEHDPMAQEKKMAEGDNTRPRRDAA